MSCKRVPVGGQVRRPVLQLVIISPAWVCSAKAGCFSNSLIPAVNDGAMMSAPKIGESTI